MKLLKKGQRAVAEAIRALDPEGSVVALDPEKKTVQYGKNLILHEQLSVFDGEEEVARAYVVAWLCKTAGYPPNIELEKRYSIGRPKEGAELDILIRRPDGTPYALIEMKAPDEFDLDQDKFIKGQLFNIAPLEVGCAVLCYATVEITDKGVGIKCISIHYTQHRTYAGWKDSRACSNCIPLNYGEVVHVHYAYKGAKDLRHNVTDKEFGRLPLCQHD